jgi:hypothetical protein
VKIKKVTSKAEMVARKTKRRGVMKTTKNRKRKRS